VSDRRTHGDQKIWNRKSSCRVRTNEALGGGSSRLPGSLFSFREPVQSKLRIPAIVPQHPNPDIRVADVVQEMIGEAVQITAPKPTSVKMEILRISNGLLDPNLKLREEILPKLTRHTMVLGQNRVQVRLHAPMESSFHAGEAQQRVRRM
jgi:hypothetical protein